MTWAERLAAVENRFLDRFRSRHADEVAEQPPTGTLSSFAGHHCCVLVTYRQDGRPVPSPLWFGVGDGRIYVHTAGAKLQRLRRQPTVLVAPSTFRGRATAPPLAATATVLGPDDVAEAEAAIAANLGLRRRVYYATLGRGLHDLATYVALAPL